MGSGEIGIPAFRMLLGREDCDVVGLVTQPDRAAGRGMTVRESAIKSVALEGAVTVLQPERLRADGAFDELAALRPDVIVVMAYGQILRREVLELPPVACLNLHASVLPRWRGAAPIQAAIAAGDAVTGITVMHMAEGLDTGDILLVRETPIAADETGGTLHDRLAELAPVALADALDRLVGGDAVRVPQDEAAATVTRKLTREDGRIDWSRVQLSRFERLIRAMDPWPGAWGEVLVGGTRRKIKVFGGEPAVEALAGGVAEVTEREGEVIAGTGDGGLVLKEVQAEGRRRMAARDWLRGLRGGG